MQQIIDPFLHRSVAAGDCSDDRQPFVVTQVDAPIQLLDPRVIGMVRCIPGGFLDWDVIPGFRWFFILWIFWFKIHFALGVTVLFLFLFRLIDQRLRPVVHGFVRPFRRRIDLACLSGFDFSGFAKRQVIGKDDCLICFHRSGRRCHDHLACTLGKLV